LQGEAVAAGMIIENIISNETGILDASEMGEINDYIIKVFGLLEIRESDIQSIMQLALQDKKNKNGVIRASLLNQIGEASWDIPITHDELNKAMHIYINL
jgi:3-dehydroquinate synthase